ncbi:MAG TPA: 4-hydroxy-tetrahydrodipicolinate reductase [Gammaproteobacteria bacterium]|nr:4-hydroxy-tetrahydrodipicolinate reductase [Gammaproteobacteria bacterium]
MKTGPLKLALFGAAGRMGCEIIAALRQSPDFQLIAAVGRHGSEAIGHDIGEIVGGPPLGVALSADAATAAKAADLVIDYSSPTGFTTALAASRAAGCAFVSGTTGLEASHHAALEAAANDIPVLYSANMTFGMAALNRLVGAAAEMLGDEFDVEIVEMHHRHKKDAPSGSALRLGKTVAAARGTTLEKSAAYGRHGEGARVPGSIGFASLRGGDVPGDHTVVFAGDGERLELTFRAGSRRIFANGVLRAAAWLAKQPAGLYSIDDLLDQG